MIEKKTTTSVLLSDIVFDEGIYPRTEGHDPSIVQEYARDMEQIEAAGKFISVNADNVLIDGRHRMLAYKKRADGKTDFQVNVYRYETKSVLESLRLAINLQDRGKSLSKADKIASAKRLYSVGEKSQAEIASAMGVSQQTIAAWLSRTLKEEKERKKDKAFSLWQSCETQDAIAEAIEMPQQTVADWIDGFTEIPEAGKSVKWSDFTPPIYNVWKKQNKSNSVDHFGNSEPCWVENLLYLYTKPASIVVDPFAGSGSTIDVCKKRGRRYYVSDRKPIVEREDEIRKHDLIAEDGAIQLPKIPRWKDVDLVYLDPPYWLQAKGQYSNDPTDLANMELDQFNKSLSDLIHGFAKKLKGGEGKYIALIIQPTQWKAPDRQFVDHVGDMLRAVKLPVRMRVSVPYESQQCNAQMVEWAKENNEILVLTREIVIWEVV